MAIQICFSVLLVLVLAVLTPLAHSEKEHSLQSLASRIEQLEQQLNQTQVATSTQSDIDRLHRIYQATQHQILQLKHSILKQQVSGLQKEESSTDPIILLQNDINQLRSNTRDDMRQLVTQVSGILRDVQAITFNSSQQFHTFQDSLDTLNTTLQDSLDTLNTTFSAPVNIYKDCRQDTERCLLQHYTGNVWHRCYTGYLQLKVTGYYTLDRRCEFVSTSTGYFHTTALYKPSGGDTVRCDCNVIHPTSSSLTTVSAGLRGDCTLVITRCPISQTVHN